jgi:hypothetical protein
MINADTFAGIDGAVTEFTKCHEHLSELIKFTKNPISYDTDLYSAFENLAKKVELAFENIKKQYEMFADGQ